MLQAPGSLGVTTIAEEPGQPTLTSEANMSPSHTMYNEWLTSMHCPEDL